MKHIKCKGTPYEIGLIHGREAKDYVLKSKQFYTDFFIETAKKSWEEVQEIALTFKPVIESKWPTLFDEMRGISDGSNLPLADIIALNVRTEIAFGLNCEGNPLDGCTSMYWNSGAEKTFLAQNWDWKEEQHDALIALEADPIDAPRYRIVTEAGIIGKIGFNEHGVGVLLNAIVANGLDTTKLPIHLALRAVLDFKSAREAIDFLNEFGGASAAHLLVADASTARGVEFSYKDIQSLEPDANGFIFHTNHFMLPHGDVEDTQGQPVDSKFRVQRIAEISKSLEPTIASVQEAFKDEKGYPGSICRHNGGEIESSTIFNIVMDLDNKEAQITEGRPSQPNCKYFAFKFE
ncbi:hypothetical protein TRVA0_029S00364 [Trichomonascus vanleenenianus]|uniref:uncharacterized protein n=1 Tax=Trichomonascus vanleenenianus TaxID=2268995 RepID=UPI003ECB026C